jgi:hypothetical protein
VVLLLAGWRLQGEDWVRGAVRVGVDMLVVGVSMDVRRELGV